MASQSDSLLNRLRSVSQVDCDTLDVEVAKALGPFVDCTSNQAIAYNELTKTTPDGKLYHEQLIRDAVKDAQSWARTAWPDIDPILLAVEIMMVRLSIQFAPFLTGNFLVQTNTKWSYSIEKTRYNGERIVEIFKKLDPNFDVKRVCIKIPSTWEGIAACRILEQKGISTLATTMFCMEQAALAADAGCAYIAPYVNELKAHFVPGYVDQHKAFDFCRQAQAYYIEKKAKTQVMAASLTSVAEVVRLAGIQHVTVSPHLLQGLATQPASTWPEEIGGYFAAGPDKAWDADFGAALQDESEWRIAFTRSGNGKFEEKLIQAINIFSDKQDSLEELARRFL
ncbi:Transaldolase 2 [Colletotrichum truncatum]|uniref:Transaldolase 2 n=1 Tax=Colletotrichum truncatum TaxID=5467 RepID=A0ACC3YCU1_COLTU|nr:Transaldolase 2 [Colletotrichum truncatum]KAF6783497.1 Transaldolase 2 [Colletotrichum truncatum]